MADNTALITLKTILGISDTSEDVLLTTYLSLAEKEILQFKYSFAADVPNSIDAEDEVTQVFAVVAGYNLIGMENQTVSIENTVHRSFKYEDMVAYIRSHVIPYARVVG